MSETTVKDICSIKSGKRLPKGCDFSTETTKYPYIRARDIKDGYIHTDELVYVDEQVHEKIKKYIINAGDIAITIVGASIGDVAFASNEVDGYNLTENAVRLTEFIDGVNSKYVFYILNSEIGQTYMKQVAGGAAQPKLGIYKIEQIPIQLPDEQIQNRIVEILSAYDDLIENNQKQIKLLEEAAQRLYKEWFVDLRYPGHEDVPVVDGVPAGWRPCILGEVIAFNPKVSLRKDRIKQCVPMSALSTNSMILNAAEFIETMSNSGSKFQNGDTLLARITPCLENGKTAYVFGLKSDEGAVGSTEFIVMRSTQLNSYMVYLLARTSDFRQTAINSMTGSDGRQRAQVNKIKDYPYLLPSKKVINSFSEIVAPIFEEIYKKNEMNSRLSQARDRLLPKLMSGEVEV